MHSTKKLPNGLTVLKVPILGAKSVLVDIFVKVGSRSEDQRTNGISHFLEHLFFKGSKLYPSAQALSHALDAIGAEYNANTGKEHTQYYIKAASKHLRFIFEVLTDVLQNPIMDEEEIGREKGVIVEEINMYEDTPIRHVDDVLEETMWPRQPLGRNIAGTKEGVKKLSRKDILHYLQTFYQPQNMIIAISGAFADGTVDALIEKHWAGLKRSTVPKWLPANNVAKGPIAKIEHKDTEQYHLTFGFYALDYQSAKNPTQAVLATILGGGMSSRLFTEIRERRGLAYYVKCGASNYQDTGNFYVKAGIRLDAFDEATLMIAKELKKMKTEQLSERELNKAKEYIKGTMTLALEDPESLLGWYLEQTAFRREVYEPNHFFRLIDKVSAKQVRDMAGEIFQAKKLHLAAIGPKRPSGKVKSLLGI